MPWALRGLRNGVLTTRWPRRPDDYADEFPSAVTVRPHADSHASGAAIRRLHEAAAACPTDAISTESGQVSLDRGRCVLCGRCVEDAPERFGWTQGADTAVLGRRALTVGAVPDTDDALEQVRAALARRVRRLRRSVHIRHVDTGSDGSDEWEIQALLNPVYDVNRLGIFITASPRHADILLVTGIGGAGMAAPLGRTREAMPDPVVVIAAGADAVSGGLFANGYASAGGAAAQLDVDVWVPGSPATPFSLLHGILLALGRVPTARGGG
ncbi:MAG: ferredoxin [Nakamurella sp.]